MNDSITIRPLADHAEYRAAEQLQLRVWGGDPVEVLPDHLLISAQRYGGVALGAFASTPEADETLIGFVFSFPGLAPDKQLMHYSHLAAVLPGYRDAQIGARLKLAQRAAVLAQGIPTMIWTYDPLQSRNAALNIGRLGATCRTYTRNYYGPMRDEINAGFPSDRLSAAWHLDSQHVAQRLERAARPTLNDMLGRGAVLLNPGCVGDPPQPGGQLPASGARVLIAFPFDLDAARRADPQAGLAWRMHVRALFEAAFAAGYTLTDLVSAPPLSYYVLEHDWSPYAD